MQLIHCENVSLAYEGKTVVQDLNMQINDGDYVCIVGENGSGKTTLMRALLGLKKTDGGKIVFSNGVSRKDIGYMPQHTAAMDDFPATVAEVVYSGIKSGLFRPFFTKEEKARVQNALRLLEIENITRESFRELSGGQQQRVLLARAMCAAKNLLLLDEPTAGLDPTMTAQLYELIQKLHQNGMTVIMISHDIPAAVRYATHILHLRHEPLFFGTAAEYAASDVSNRFLEGGQA